MRIVANLTAGDLTGITLTGEPVYSRFEEEFLGRYAPHRFSQRPLDELLECGNTSEATRMAINQQVFDVVVKLDISIARGKALRTLVEEKAPQLNPALSAFSIDGIVLGDDTLSALYNIKTKGLEVLRRTTPHGFNTFTRGVDCYDFQSERGELRWLFGDVPILVYGSRKKGSDVDTMVFPNEFTEETYRRIQGVSNPLREPPLSFVIVPKGNIPEFALSSAGNELHPDNSFLINGELIVPSVDQDYFDYLKIHRAADDYLKLRSALTPEGLAHCENILPRVNSLLKIPKFVYMNLFSTSNAGLPEPEIMQFGLLPSRAELVMALVDANLQAYRMLITYQNR